MGIFAFSADLDNGSNKLATHICKFPVDYVTCLSHLHLSQTVYGHFLHTLGDLALVFHELNHLTCTLELVNQCTYSPALARALTSAVEMHTCKWPQACTFRKFN